MFSDFLKKTRENKKLKLKDISQKSKISLGHLSHIEKNRKIPSINHFISIIEALQVTYDELKELTITYSKLIKPQQAQELIIGEFAKSEYIVSVLLDGMHFKDEFMELYRQAYQEGNKFLFYFSFFTNINYLIRATQNNNQEYAEPSVFFKAIDIMKEKSKELYELSIKPLSEEEKFRADLLKKCLKEIIDKMENNFIMEEHEIKNLINKQNISDDDKKKLSRVINFALKHIDYPIIDNNLKYIFEVPMLIFRKDDMPTFYYLYDFIRSFVLSKHEGIIFIETSNGQYYSIGFNPLYDDISLLDIMADDFTTALKTKCQELGNILLEINDYITNDDFRKNFFKTSIDNDLAHYALIRNSFMINKDIYDINKRYKKQIDILTRQNEKLTKRNRELEQEIANLKQQLDEKGNKEKN